MHAMTKKFRGHAENDSGARRVAARFDTLPMSAAAPESPGAH
jgi:hypothetical protein